MIEASNGPTRSRRVGQRQRRLMMPGRVAQQAKAQRSGNATTGAVNVNGVLALAGDTTRWTADAPPDRSETAALAQRRPPTARGGD